MCETSQCLHCEDERPTTMTESPERNHQTQPAPTAQLRRAAIFPSKHAPVLLLSPHSLRHPARLLPAVEVIPLAASTAPIIIRGLSVGKVVRILGLHVIETRSLVEVCCLRVQRRGVLPVQCLNHPGLRTCTFSVSSEQCRHLKQIISHSGLTSAATKFEESQHQLHSFVSNQNHTTTTFKTNDIADPI